MFELDLTFLKLEKIHSNKTNKDYYKIFFLYNGNTIDHFITESIFNILSEKKLEYLKNYKFKFCVSSRFNSLNLDLVDIK